MQKIKIIYRSALKSWLVIPLLFSLMCVLLQCFPAAGSVLEYNRSMIESNQIWRLFTGHFVHWSWNHVFWDVMTFFITGMIVYHSRPLNFWILIYVSCIAVSAGLYFLMHGVNVYRGISGIDLAFFSYGAFHLIWTYYKSERILSITGMIAFILMIVKIIYEAATGAAVFVNASGYTLIPLSHGIGAAAGFLIWALTYADIYGKNLKKSIDLTGEDEVCTEQ